MLDFLGSIAAFLLGIGIFILFYALGFAILVGIIGLIFWLICLGFDLVFNWWIVLGIAGIILLIKVAYEFIFGGKKGN